MEGFFDIGGTNFRYEIYRDSLLIHKDSTKSNSFNVFNRVEEIAKSYNLSRVGISFAGQVDKGRVISSPNIKIEPFDIASYFLSLGIECRVENDLKAIALAHRDIADSFVALFIGSGFGGAIVDHGELFRGEINLAGEVGHIPYKKSPFMCGCGGDGCLELFCSGLALKRWIEYRNLDISPTLQALKNSKNEDAKEIVENFYDALMLLINTLAPLLNIKTFILGGGVVEQNGDIIDFIKDRLSHSNSTFLSNISIEKSSIKDAGIKGARMLFE